jgi:xylulokinase
VAELIGLDIGTTNLKAVFYDVERHAQIVESCPTRTIAPRPGWAEYDPREMWESVAGLLRSGMKAIPGPAEITAIAVASMGEAGLIIDAQGNPLSPIIAWFDARTGPQGEWWQRNVGEETVYDITGQPLHPMFGINKLMWLRDNAPEDYGRARHWLSVSDWILYRLSAVVATDYSVASRTMAFDIEAHRWSEKLLAAARIDPRLMPAACCGGTAIGAVTPRAAAQTGLPAGTPVVTGGHDHLCASLAVGAHAPGGLMDSTGTGESIVLTSPCVQRAPHLRRQKLAQECHVVDGRYVILAGFTVAGYAVEWVSRLLEHGEAAPDFGLEGAAGVPPGSGGLFFMPHLRGSGSPTMNLDCRGAFLGVGAHHGGAHLVRAAIEGVCYELKSNLRVLESAAGASIERVIAVGKVTASPLWLQVKADISGKTIVVPEISEMTGVGAALLAGLGTGVFSTPEDAVRSLGTTHRVVAPIPENTALYDTLYESVYSRIYAALEDLHRTMAGSARAATVATGVAAAAGASA